MSTSVRKGEGEEKDERGRMNEEEGDGEKEKNEREEGGEDTPHLHTHLTPDLELHQSKKEKNPWN